MIRLLFWAGLLIRIVFLFTPCSEYVSKLFMPFLDQWVQHPTTNPWSNYDPKFFPYGSVLFLILALPKLLGFWIFGERALGTLPLSLALFKLPLLGLDFELFRTLVRMDPLQSRRLTIFYWLNPILIFITYIHGQLDLAAMLFTFIGFQALLRKKHLQSALWLAFATLCKFHVASIIPLILVYFWNRSFFSESAKKILSWGAVYAAVCAVGFLPVIASGRIFYTTTASPEALRMFAARIVMGEQGPIFFFGFMLWFVVLLRLCLSTRLTDRGLIYGCGLIFGTLVFVTNPGPGWFFWIIPFLCLFLAQNNTVPRTLGLALVVTYFIYFTVATDAATIAGPFRLSDFPVGIAFTLLQSSLGSFLIFLYLLVLKREAPLQYRSRPYMIGIAGDSGSGKNVLSGLLAKIFDPGRTLLLEGDDYHKWERGDQAWASYTPLNPKANELHSMLRHSRQLSTGRTISNKHYDHATGKFDTFQTHVPQRTVVVQGLHTFFLRNQRDQFDLKIFLNPDAGLREAWKTKRDVNERGHNPEQIKATLAARTPDSSAHIAPQIEHADWIVEYLALDAEDQEAGAFYVRHTIWNDTPVAALLDELTARNWCKAEMQFISDDLSRVQVTLKPLAGASPSPTEMRKIARVLFPELRQLTRGYVPPEFEPGFNGILQLFALTLISGRLEV